ncbi:hypothetical protein FPANT_9119 [Fusarium pseudoanthophilum]|uniref:Uncharacterized protein n=1 Tax=Fusarium pseudoanthophilum TaxID=48495 RepID=A0A8H5NWI2_9HYPO|nr:hypothetical protein FPANT_9119 [Fusarium pseudoanthophilum]
MPALATLTSDLRVEFHAAKSPAQILVDQTIMPDDFHLGDLEKVGIEHSGEAAGERHYLWGQLKRGIRFQVIHGEPRIGYVAWHPASQLGVLDLNLKISIGIVHWSRIISDMRSNSPYSSRFDLLQHSSRVRLQLRESASKSTTTNATPDPTTPNLSSPNTSAETSSVTRWILTRDDWEPQVAFSYPVSTTSDGASLIPYAGWRIEFDIDFYNDLLRRALGIEKARRHSHATTHYSCSSYIETFTGLERQEYLLCLQADRHRGEDGGTAGDYDNPNGPNGQYLKYLDFKPDTVISESGGYPYLVHNTWYLSETNRLVTQYPQLRGGYVAVVRNSNNITFGTPARIPTPHGPEILY